MVETKRGQDVEKWRYGLCYPMAIALGRHTGWPVKALVVDAQRSAWRPHVVHAWVEAPCGTAYDGAGSFDALQMRDELLDPTRNNWRNERLESCDSDGFLALLGKCSGPHWVEDRKWLEKMIPDAEAHLASCAFLPEPAPAP